MPLFPSLLSSLRHRGAERGSRSVLRVTEAAQKTFGTEEKARRWLLRPTNALSGMSPLALASTGAEGEGQVLDLLSRIDHGLAV